MAPEKAKLWQMAIGRLILAFGFIEMRLNQLLAFWLAEEVFVHIESEPLSKRLRLAKALAPAHSSNPEFVAEIVTLLNGIEELAERRNMVAHNPVVMNAKRLQTGKWEMKNVIRHRKVQAKILSLPDLEDVAAASENASNALSRLLCQAVGQIVQGQHGKAGPPRFETIAKLLGAEPMGISAAEVCS